MDKLLYGVAYYDEYMPCERLDKDIEMMKRAGINVVRIGESTWSTFEPREGEFNFTSLIRVVEAMKDAGISVIVGTPTYAIPTWMVKKHPEVLAVTDSGRGIYGPRQIMDITNKDYLFYSERAIRKMMEKMLVYENVIGVQIDNETKAYGTAGKNVQEGFKNYLRETFGQKLKEDPGLLDSIPDRYKGLSEDVALDYINYEFGFDYWSNRINAWEDFPDVRGTINGSFKGEFKKYQRKLVTDFLSFQAGIVREYLREDQFITHNTDFNWIGYSYGINGETDVYDNCKVLDIAGVDIYHPSQDKLTGMEIAFGGDVTRSVKGNNYYVLETQAQGFPGWTPLKNQLRQQAYAHIANGADMVEYWHWHSLHNSFETYWKGVLSHDFKENAIYKEASVVGNEFKKIGSKIMHLKKNNKVAIYVSQRSLTALDVFPIDETFNVKYNDVLMDIYEELYRLNVECDFIWPQNIGDLNKYELVFTPAMYAASQEEIDALKKYVEDGGNLFTTFKSAFANEHTKVWHDETPHGLSKVFGVSYSEFMWPGDVRLIYKGKENDTDLYKVRDFMELLNIEDGASPEVLAYYSHPGLEKTAAITRNTFGKGSSVYMGCRPSKEMLSLILEDALRDIGLLTCENRFPVIQRSGINSEGKKVDFYFNFSQKEVTAKNVNEGEDILTGEKCAKGGNITVKPWGVVIVTE